MLEMFLSDKVLLKCSVNKCSNREIWLMSRRDELNKIGRNRQLFHENIGVLQEQWGLSVSFELDECGLRVVLF